MTDDEREPRGDGEESPGDLVERLETTIGKIETAADEDDLGPVVSHLDDVEDILDEAEDVLSTVDLASVADAIDWGSLPEAVDLSEVPDAFETGEAERAVDLGRLLDATDLSAVMDSVDTRELRREKRELDDELEDVTDDDPDDGWMDADLDVDASPGDGGMSGHDVDPAVIQAAVQSEISDAVGEFREKLLEAHQRLEAVREENQERFDERRTSANSRNPTAGFSTVPSNHAGGATAGRYAFSTVPEETRYSTAPNRKRIYGRRFETLGGDGDG